MNNVERRERGERRPGPVPSTLPPACGRGNYVAAMPFTNTIRFAALPAPSGADS